MLAFPFFHMKHRSDPRYERCRYLFMKQNTGQTESGLTEATPSNTSDHVLKPQLQPHRGPRGEVSRIRPLGGKDP